MSDNLFEPQEGQQSTQTADPTTEQQTPQGQESISPRPLIQTPCSQTSLQEL